MKTNECKQFNTKEADTLQTTEFSKTSRKPKKQKKQYSRTPAKVKMPKFKKPRENQKKTKKTKKKKQYSRTLAKVKCKKPKNLEKTKKKNKKKTIFQKSGDRVNRQESWNIVFLVFSRHFTFFLNFGIFTFAGFGILENSRFFWNCKGIGQKEVGITFSFYWQCLNRTKTVKTGGSLQFSNTCTRKYVKNTVFFNVFECST